GLGQYTEHITLPNMLYTRTLRSPHPHARVKAVDITKAQQVAGVASILYRGNLPQEYQDTKLGAGPPDRGLFDEEVFEVGAPVAVVAAESEHIADEAMRLIEVQYEVLPAAMDFLEAMKSSTAKQFDSQLDGLVGQRQAEHVLHQPVGTWDALGSVAGAQNPAEQSPRGPTGLRRLGL